MKNKAVPDGGNKRCLVLVAFKAPIGGLHLNVLGELRALRSCSYDPVLMCKPGFFSNMVKAEGFEVIETNFESHDEDVNLGMLAGPYRFVHAHPGSGRKIGSTIAKKSGVPFLITFHGMWSDSFEKYARDVSVAFTVSAAVRDNLVNTLAVDPSKIFVLANGVSTEKFFREEALADDALALFPSLRNFDGDGRKTILIVSRLDVDKAFIIDLILETWTSLAATNQFAANWIVAGDGTQIDRLREGAAKYEDHVGRKAVEFVGWQGAEMLNLLYNIADIAICPGRSVLEAMSCGKPVIAVGSKSYVGVIDSSTFLKGWYQNFGGFGKKNEDYEEFRMVNDLSSMVNDSEYCRSIGENGRKFVEMFADQKILDETFIRHVEFAVSLHEAKKRRS